MTWFKVDDSFWANPKVLRISAEAIALWVKAGAWSCQNLTDGHIDKSFIPIFRQPDTAADELEDAGLWEDHGDTWYFHDWDQYQETSEAVKKRREQSRERQRKARAAREDKRTDTAPQASVTQPVTRDITREFSTPDPTRPDLKRTSSSPATPPMEFEAFWDAYPRRVGKQAAIKAWAKAVKVTDPQHIINGAKSYAATVRDKDPQYTAHPSSWLNAGRWDDEQPTTTPAFDPWATEGVHA